MSKAAVKWARQQSLPMVEKAVLLALAEDYSPRWGVSGPTQSSVAATIGTSREAVNRAIKRLAIKGLIRVISEDRKRGEWDRRSYALNPAGGGIERPKPGYRRASHRVTQDHTAPCDADETRHRVTQDHTSRATYAGARISFPPTVRANSNVSEPKNAMAMLRGLIGGEA